MIPVHVFVNGDEYEFSAGFDTEAEAKAFKEGLSDGASLFAGSISTGNVVNGKVENEDGEEIEMGEGWLKQLLEKDAELRAK